MHRIQSGIGESSFVKSVINQTDTADNIHQQKNQRIAVQNLLSHQTVADQTNYSPKPAEKIEIFLVNHFQSPNAFRVDSIQNLISDKP